MDAADTLYLQPRDFTGTPQALDTPEGFYPTTGVNSLTADTSEAQGVPSDDVHFVLVGDTAAPNGGLLERFDFPGFPSSDLAVPSFGVTFGDPAPDDLYPPTSTPWNTTASPTSRIPIDPLSDLNALPA